MNFRPNNIEWFFIYLDIPFSNDNWNNILKYFKSNKKSLITKKNKLILEKNLKEENKDYHIHFRLTKDQKKGKDKYELELGLHIEPSKRKKLNSKYKEYKIKDFFNWFSNYIPSDISKKKINTVMHLNYEYDSTKYSAIFNLPFADTSFLSDENKLLGQTHISGLGFEFKNSKIGLNDLFIETNKKKINLIMMFETKINFTNSFFEEFVILSNSVAKIFVNSRGQNL